MFLIKQGILSSLPSAASNASIANSGAYSLRSNHDKGNNTPTSLATIHPPQTTSHPSSVHVIELIGFPKQKQLPSDGDVKRFLEPFGIVSSVSSLRSSNPRPDCSSVLLY